MNRERILKMASVAGVYIYEGSSFAEDCYLNLLDDVAAAAAAEEREAICRLVQDMFCGADADKMVKVIRARGNT